MIKTLRIESIPEGIRLAIITEYSNAKKNDHLATFGGLSGFSNLHARMLLAAMAQSDDLIDTVDIELTEALAATIARVGHWMQELRPAQASLVHAASMGASA